MGAYPHHEVRDSWLYPSSQPSIQFAWGGEGWPQTAAAQRRIREALQERPFDSLELRVSVSSPMEPVRVLAEAILDAHGGVAQVELRIKLWFAADLQAGSVSAATFAS